MKQDMYDLAAWAIQTTKAAGADACRVGLDNERNVEISYRERKPEKIKEASTKALGLEIFVNGRYSLMSTSDLRKNALKDFIIRAVAATRLLAEDPYRTLPDPKYYQGRPTLDLGLVDSSYGGLTPEMRHNYVKALEDACLAKGGDKVISVTASCSDSHQESVLMASNGFDGYIEATIFSGGAEMTARDAGDRRPAEAAYAAAVNRKSMPKPEEIGLEAAARTLVQLGAKKIKTETLPIIIENRVAARVGTGFLQAMFGRSIQQKQSFLADKKGKKVASERLTLIDDPLITGGLGSQLFNGEGFAAKPRTMIEAGVLKDFFVDWYYSRKLGWEPTTAQPSNLVIPPGKRAIREIMKDLGRGILITGFIGGNSNSTTGDWSIGISGQLFDGGEPGQAVSEMNIADNHLKFWQRLAEVGNDPWLYSPQRFPSLVFTEVVVSGI
jgi:PmbA protein